MGSCDSQIYCNKRHTQKLNIYIYLGARRAVISLVQSVFEKGKMLKNSLSIHHIFLTVYWHKWLLRLLLLQMLH